LDERDSECGVIPMDYEPWPYDGCSLLEAWRRLADTRSLAAAKSTFSEFVHSRKLVVVSRVSTSVGLRRATDFDVWRRIAGLDWSNLSATDDGRGDSVFDHVRVFPALLADQRADILDGVSLARAFADFVLEDPEVHQLASKARAKTGKYDSVFLKGRCHPRGDEHWPLAFERWSMVGVIHPDPKKRSLFDRNDPDPIEVIVAVEALIHRYMALIGMLRSGEISAEGLPVQANYPAVVPLSVWSHHGFSMLADGTILKFDEDEGESSPHTNKCWSAVMLHAASKHSSPRDPEFDGPTEFPFSIDQVVSSGSLADALADLVLRADEIEPMRLRAMTAATSAGKPFESDAGLVGLVYGHDEPVIPLRYFARAEWDRGLLPGPPGTPGDVDAWLDPEEEIPEVSSFYEAVNKRASTLFAMLQRKQVGSWGHSIDGHIVPIAPTIWSHPDFYVHPPTGDIYDGTSNPMTKRWTGVVLAHAGAAPFPVPYRGTAKDTEPTFHVKPTVFAGLPSTSFEPQPDKTSKGIRRVTTTTAARKACLDWLVKIMRESPVRNRTNNDLWDEAKARWPKTLSERSFHSARADAIRISGSLAWGAAGAPQRSNHRGD
jgi:hypothetical protein